MIVLCMILLCMGSEDTIVFMICLNFDSMLLHHSFKFLIIFEIFLTAVSCLEISIAESGCLINTYHFNVVAFGGKSSCQLWNDTSFWKFELIYQYVLSLLCRFVCVILLDPFINPLSKI